MKDKYRNRSYSSQSDNHKKKRKHKDKHRKHHKKHRSSSSERDKSKQRKPQQIIKIQNIPQPIVIKPQADEYINEDGVLTKKQLPCFEPSGILLKFYNARDGVSLKFHQPPEGRPPIDSWRLYTFKGEEVLNPIILSNSVYLIGKDQRICDILCENPSISRQHAVIQFRLIQKIQIDGSYLEMVKPYVMDIQSTNGTLLNDQPIEPLRYFELLHRDVLKFGFSQRQYVIVKDDVPQE